MLIYNYDSITKEYTGYEEAYLDPEETKIQGKDIYLVPANATTEVPSETGENQVNIFETDHWTIESDFRGQKMVDEAMIPESVSFIGTLPEGYVLITEEQIRNINIKGRNYYVIENNELVINPDYDQEQATKREVDFKSKFFNINGFGWYRKQPKGYSSAVESINSAYNSFTEMQKLGLAENFPANTLIFYQQPDFTKPEQCTEEWLVAHQMLNQEMTPQQFGQFYIGFIQAWNTQEHEQSESK